MAIGPARPNVASPLTAYLFDARPASGLGDICVAPSAGTEEGDFAGRAGFSRENPSQNTTRRIATCGTFGTAARYVRSLASISRRSSPASAIADEPPSGARPTRVVRQLSELVL